MVWKVGEAKQKFSEVLRRAAAAPQVIQNRERVVGAVIGATDARAFFDFKARGHGPLGAMLREAREICEEEGEALLTESREDRRNAMLEGPRAGRHQRRQ